MKFATLATLVTVAVGVAAAQPHKHQHNHKRASDNVVTVYVLNGQPISAQEVQEGIKNGTLVFDLGTGAVAPAPAAAVVKKPKHKLAISSTSTVSVDDKPNPSPATAVIPTPSSDDSSSEQLSSSSGSSGSSSSGSFSQEATGVDSDFPSGEIACNDFPSKYGAMAVPWMGYGGYTGIQAPGSSSGGFSNIVTKVASMCSGADCCDEGSYCSYACPPGYQKSQWPTTQGATGQSVGGLLCQNGKLQLTNPGMSKSLCMKGAEQVNVQVKNTMSEVASVCRTDYPGEYFFNSEPA